MNLGERIRELRKAAGYTQQEVADTLGTTCQSVSRWETGITLPDIAVIPSICSLLRVSADELLGINDQKQRDEIDALLKATGDTDLQSRENLVRFAKTLRKALRRYPGEIELMKRLYEVLQGLAEHALCDEDATEYRALLNEQLDLCNLMLRRVPEGEERFRLIAGKCLLLHDMGRQEEAVSLAHELPSGNTDCRSTLLSILTGEELAAHCRSSIPDSFGDLILNVIPLISCKNDKEAYMHSAVERLAMTDALIDACEAFWGEAGAPDSALRSLYILSIASAAAIHAEAGRRDEALAYCEKAAERLDRSLDTKSELLRGLFSGHGTKTASEQEAVLQSNRMNLIDKLSQPVFDGIRNDERFLAVIEKLKG